MSFYRSVNRSDFGPRGSTPGAQDAGAQISLICALPPRAWRLPSRCTGLQSSICFPPSPHRSAGHSAGPVPRPDVPHVTLFPPSLLRDMPKGIRPLCRLKSSCPPHLGGHFLSCETLSHIIIEFFFIHPFCKTLRGIGKSLCRQGSIHNSR